MSKTKGVAAPPLPSMSQSCHQTEVTKAVTPPTWQQAAKLHFRLYETNAHVRPCGVSTAQLVSGEQSQHSGALFSSL